MCECGMIIFGTGDFVDPKKKTTTKTTIFFCRFIISSNTHKNKLNIQRDKPRAARVWLVRARVKDVWEWDSSTDKCSDSGRNQHSCIKWNHTLKLHTIFCA